MKACIAALAVSVALSAPARAAAPPTAAFAAPAAIKAIEISPDGQRLAIIGRDGNRALVKFATIDKATMTLARLGDVAVSRLRWLDNDRVIVDVDFPTKIFDHYRTVGRIVVISANDGKAVTMLADNKPSNRILRHWVSGISPDKYLYMWGYPPILNSSRAALPVLLKVDPSSGVGEVIEQGTGETADWGVNKGGVVDGRTIRLKNGDFAIMYRPASDAPFREAWRSTGLVSREGRRMPAPHRSPGPAI